MTEFDFVWLPPSVMFPDDGAEDLSMSTNGGLTWKSTVLFIRDSGRGRFRYCLYSGLNDDGRYELTLVNRFDKIFDAKEMAESLAKRRHFISTYVLAKVYEPRKKTEVGFRRCETCERKTKTQDICRGRCEKCFINHCEDLYVEQQEQAAERHWAGLGEHPFDL